jgi:hypothetical protein
MDGGSEMNEHDMERHLQRQPLARPSANLDQQMERLFQVTRSEHANPLARTVPMWLMAAACLVCALAGFGVRSLFVPRQSAPTVVYVFPPSEAMTRFLTGAAANRNDGFDFAHARVQVINPSVSAGNQL